MPHPAPPTSPLETLAGWLRDADRILIGAGAGLTAAAGIDYTDTEAFARVFPAFAARGLRAQYQMIGLPMAPELLWGYWAVHVDYVRYDPRPNPLYQQLRELVGERDHFVWTSNVDGLFTRNGFAADRVYTPQGDYALYQCTGPCTRQVWDFTPVMERLLASVDPDTGAVTDPAAIPHCPRCGADVFLNVRLDASFIDDHFSPTGERLVSWLKDTPDPNLVVLDIGTGWNTPVVVRKPMENIAMAFPASRLARINRDHAQVPERLGDRAVSLSDNADTVIRRLAPPGTSGTATHAPSGRQATNRRRSSAR
ncbi:NAD-dependent protein deacetylase of SIR2 family [Streptomyces sp. NPDC008150]|uniref:NAD-dependent protein deacetylase of SIR2 family n=1 Tax=Streptomyces sp. NPDC008150 TaxID=3364816 RepID=UPI0036E7F5D3